MTTEAGRRVVESGLTVEFVRASRYHDASGNRGDQLTPVLEQKP